MLFHTCKLPVIKYASPDSADTGNKVTSTFSPLITIAPGFTPPIVEPIGRLNPPSGEAEIVTPPKSKV